MTTVQQCPGLRCFLLSAICSSPRDASIERSSDLSDDAACENEGVPSLARATTRPLTGKRLADSWTADTSTGPIDLLSRPCVARDALKTDEPSRTTSPLPANK